MAEDFDLTIPPPFSVAKLAEHWGCSPSMIRKLINQGRLGHFRIGILTRISRASVEEFERLNTIGGVPVKAMEPKTAPAEANVPLPAPSGPAAPRIIPRKRRRRIPIER
ncbi:hypothetical protein Sphch_3158 [Sphingobium chlorophenolicum L-1]|uniref:Helix-turn-helix domain-containing protein n=1 Tax=Sphingobium chlorophenolicum L-1 TaxID=690566 RepID=F6F2W1_SPHCR|nr:hypothetical protein Sphch_3158 [Sphingobium chlorophenolicum L-1]